MDQPLWIPAWRDRVVYSAGGPKPQILHEDDRIKVVVVGLEPDAQIPVHEGGAGVYHFLEGEGQMEVAGRAFDARVGSTVIVPDGAARGMQARTRLAFIAVRLA